MDSANHPESYITKHHDDHADVDGLSMLNWVEARIKAEVKRVAPFMARVELVQGELVQIIRTEGDVEESPNEPDAPLYARSRGFAVDQDDLVLCVNVGNEPFIIAAIDTDVPDLLNLNTDLVVNGQIVAASLGGNYDAAGLTGGPISLSVIPPDILTSYLVTASVAQSSADTTSNTSTTNYATAAEILVTLPAGTWSVRAVGGLELVNTGGSAGWLIQINSVDGTARSLSESTAMMVVDDGLLPGVTGGGDIPVRVRYRPNAAGTASARNPWLMVIAHRTA